MTITTRNTTERSRIRQTLEDELTVAELDGKEPTVDEVAAVPARAGDSEGSGDDSVRAYLRQIGKVPLLKAADERRLARQIEEWHYTDVPAGTANVRGVADTVNDPAVGSLLYPPLMVHWFLPCDVR